MPLPALTPPVWALRRPWLLMAVTLLADAVLLRVLPSTMYAAMFYWLMG